MGRTVKRVPLDLDWPLGEVWVGYLNRELCPTCECRKGRRAECDECDGRGYVWVDTEPPSGDGWQYWETTTEGSPMSPVYATRSGLARWLAMNESTINGETGARMTYQDWLRDLWQYEVRR